MAVIFPAIKMAGYLIKPRWGFVSKDGRILAKLKLHIFFAPQGKGILNKLFRKLYNSAFWQHPYLCKANIKQGKNV